MIPVGMRDLVKKHAILSVYAPARNGCGRLPGAGDRQQPLAGAGPLSSASYPGRLDLDLAPFITNTCARPGRHALASFDRSPTTWPKDAFA